MHAADRGPRAPTSPPSCASQLDELRETARSGAEDVRRIAQRLRPEALEELGLQSALAALATAFGEQAGVRGRPAHSTATAELDREQELVVYRVAQEALTNVARHAHARPRRASSSRATTTATVVLQRARRRPRAADAGRCPSSHGIRGMRERAMLIGARADDRLQPPAAAPRSCCASRRSAALMPTPLKTRILIADDHPIVLRGLRKVLDAQPDLEVVAEASDGDEAVERALAGGRRTSRSSTSRCRA